MKRLVLTAHARIRLQERELDPKWIEDTARRPDWIEPEPGDSTLERRFGAIPQADGRILRVVCAETDDYTGRQRYVRPEREAQAMIDMTYDPEADAVYIYVGRGKVDRQKSIGNFIADIDADGRILGIEILSASKALTPGDWQKAPRPGEKRIDAAE